MNTISKHCVAHYVRYEKGGVTFYRLKKTEENDLTQILPTTLYFTRTRIQTRGGYDLCALTGDEYYPGKYRFTVSLQPLLAKGWMLGTFYARVIRGEEMFHRGTMMFRFSKSEAFLQIFYFEYVEYCMVEERKSFCHSVIPFLEKNNPFTTEQEWDD